jgi:hypothetical protein
MGLKDPFPVFLGFFECLTVFSRFDPGTPPVPEFGLWLKGRLNLSPACFALDELYTELGSAGAYEAIWRYLDEYRACREVTLRGIETNILSHGSQRSPNTSSIAR